MLQHERDQRQHLQEMVEQLARQHSHLEEAAHRHRPSKFWYKKKRHGVVIFSEVYFLLYKNPLFSDPISSTTSDDDENEFYDAQELSQSQDDGTFSLKIPPSRSLSNLTGASSSEDEELNSCETEPHAKDNESVRENELLIVIYADE